MFSLLDILDQFSLLGEWSDERVGIPSNDEAFFVASFFSALTDEGQPVSHLNDIWKWRIPPRVAIFAWLAIRGRIFLADNLWHRNIGM